jgi:putative (di)nucleoside polyphosphate hydrolase
MSQIPVLEGYRPNVGLVIINRDNKVLMGERQDIAGVWQLPQGGIDDGETPLQTALRELVEETGITPDKVEVIDEYPLWLPYIVPPHLRFGPHATYKIGQIQKWFLLRYKLHDLPTPPQDGEIEFTAFKWVPLQDLAKDVIYFRKAIYEELAVYFSKHLPDQQ